jgi:hypothetical protein
MNFLKLSTMQYPLQEGDIRLEYPEITENQTGATFPVPADYVSVEQTTPPSYDPKTQYLSQSTPVQANGAWQSVWVVNDFTAEQLAMIAEMSQSMLRKKKPPTTNSGTAPNVIA